jgi:hypothetical protein
MSLSDMSKSPAGRTQCRPGIGGRGGVSQPAADARHARRAEAETVIVGSCSASWYQTTTDLGITVGLKP